MTMDYKYIEQLLDRYFECETSLEEEQILRAFFAQENVPVRLLAYRELFSEQTRSLQEDTLDEEFDQRIMSLVNQNANGEAEPQRVKAKMVSLNKRLRPFYKAAACVAVVLALGQAAQMPYAEHEAEQQEELARSLQQLQQLRQDRNAVAQTDSAATNAEAMPSAAVISN